MGGSKQLISHYSAVYAMYSRVSDQSVLTISGLLYMQCIQECQISLSLLYQDF